MPRRPHDPFTPPARDARRVDATVLPIPRQTMTSMAVESLRERILRGQFAEGEPLRQDALADELGVSRIPIREALRQLDAEGLVTFSPHRGAVVSTLSLSEIEELFELRADIEGRLLRRAIPLMTPDDLARAKDILDAYEVAFRSGEVAAWGALNWQFHSTLYAPAGRHFTMSVIHKLHQHSDRYLRMQLALTHGETRATDEHRAIYNAVRRREVAKACQLMRDHILGAGELLVTFLEAQRAARDTEDGGARVRRRRGR